MKNIREYSFWDGEVTGLNEYAIRDKDWPVFIMGNIFVLFFAALFCAVTLGIGLELAGVNGGIFMGTAPSLILGPAFTSLSYVYKGHGMPLPKVSYRGTYGHNFWQRAEEYFSLPKEDRSAYPADIIETMRDPDLTCDQRVTLDNHMRDIYASIVKRNKVRAELSRRHVDISAITEYMKDARDNINVETDTYKEFLD